MLFDSHCHLTSDAFDGERDEVVERARAAGVGRIVTIASTPDDAEAALSLVRGRPGLWTTAGVHPHEAESGDRLGGDLEPRLTELLAREGVVAVGECGLDFYYDNAPRAAQLRVFERHVRVAEATGLPLVVHSRSADDAMAGVLRDLPRGVTGVLHCFTGSDALLETALEAGFHVSFTGIVSFSGYGQGHQVAAVPEDRFMVETDAPYLAPVPHRGTRNEPARVAEVAAAVARHRGADPEAVARASTRNALRFYGLGEDAPVLGPPDGGPDRDPDGSVGALDGGPS